MELNEFKDLWNQQAEEHMPAPCICDVPDGSVQTTALISRLTRTTQFWWKFTWISIALLIGCIFLNIGMFFFFPEKFQNLPQALPVFAIIGFFGLVTLWIYYQKARILEVEGSANLKVAWQKVIDRFRRWYTLFTLTYIALFPPVFYVVIKIGLQPWHIRLATQTEVLLSLLLSLVSLVLNHLYYKKTYFTWLASLENKLKELSEDPR